MLTEAFFFTTECKFILNSVKYFNPKLSCEINAMFHCITTLISLFKIGVS